MILSDEESNESEAMVYSIILYTDPFHKNSLNKQKGDNYTTQKFR